MKLIYSLTLAVLFFSCNSHKRRFISDLAGQKLPTFELVLADSVTKFNTVDISSDSPFTLFLYQPYCPHCRAVTRNIIKEINFFQNVKIYMITPYSFSLIRQYNKLFELGKYPNVVLARDSKRQLEKYFKVPGVPYLAYYDRKRRLQQVILGEVDVAMLKELVN